MKFSMLIYECVKESINLADSGFSYATFVNGGYSNDADHKMQLEGAFPAVNRALSRLHDLDKVKYSLLKAEILDSEPESGIWVENDGGCYIAHIKSGEIVNVAERFGGSYRKLPISLEGSGKDAILGRKPVGNSVTIEYRPEIPHFSQSDILPFSEGSSDPNADMSDYGITDSMCDMIKEYAKAELTEYISPDLSRLHKSDAESYFSAVPKARSAFRQDHIDGSYNSREAF